MELPVDYNSLTIEQKRQVRQYYTNKQGGICIHCRGSLDLDPPSWITKKRINWSLFPKGFLRYKNHLHHNHDTGMTIGTVHSYCNAVLWQYHGE